MPVGDSRGSFWGQSGRRDFQPPRQLMTHSGHRGGFQFTPNKRLDASFDHSARGRPNARPAQISLLTVVTSVLRK
jgi:hypothetical protein